jgi:hypothetical protein
VTRARLVEMREGIDGDIGKFRELLNLTLPKAQRQPALTDVA